MEHESLIRTTPGCHPDVKNHLSYATYGFEKDEIEIIKRLSHQWYVTRIGEFRIGKTSTYRFALIKPTTLFQEMFNLEREITAIFSPYESFEPRSINAFDEVIKMYQTMRIDNICGVLISKDEDIETKIVDLIKQNPESQVIIPFTYRELQEIKDDYFLRNRFIKYFYSRDLFAFESPLKKDLYFFGRNDLIHGIVSRHLSKENYGLFGLRKTGKTSVVFGVIRTLEKIGEKAVFIDCQSPSFHIRRWNEALYYVLKQTAQDHHLKFDEKEIDFTEKNAAMLFERTIEGFCHQLGNKSIMLIFDEIENVTYGISPSKHWETELDFVLFWQSIRSSFQRLTRVFSVFIVGTNPICVEQSMIGGKDNPIYNFIPFDYIGLFDVPQTREMVRKLGRYMGMHFSETVYTKLTEGYGGHPFLIRHICSFINQRSSKERPVKIDRVIYEKSKRRV